MIILLNVICKIISIKYHNLTGYHFKTVCVFAPIICFKNNQLVSDGMKEQK